MKKKLIGYEAFVLDGYVNNMKLVPVVRKRLKHRFNQLLKGL